MIQGPRRTQVQRKRSGPRGVIGAPPKSAAPPATLRYQGALKAKQAKDRATVARIEGARRKKRGAPGSRRPSRREIYAARNGNGAAVQNGNANGMAGESWWANPWIWAAVAGVWWLSRRKK